MYRFWEFLGVSGIGRFECLAIVQNGILAVRRIDVSSVLTQLSGVDGGQVVNPGDMKPHPSRRVLISSHMLVVRLSSIDLEELNGTEVRVVAAFRCLEAKKGKSISQPDGKVRNPASAKRVASPSSSRRAGTSPNTTTTTSNHKPHNLHFPKVPPTPFILSTFSICSTTASPSRP
jgi:hypothetical protein